MLDHFNNILVVAPHADDEVLGVGGTVNSLVSRGKNVHLIVCANRSHDIDYSECQKQYTSVINLGLIDEQIKAAELIKLLEPAYISIKPQVVFIPNRDDFNMDHREVYHGSQVVLRRYQQHPPRVVMMYEVPSSTTQSFKNNFHCNYYQSITQNDVEQKINVLYKYTKEVREFPNPRSKQGIMTYAMFRGMECNSEYAEGFNIIYMKHEIN